MAHLKLNEKVQKQICDAIEKRAFAFDSSAIGGGIAEICAKMAGARKSRGYAPGQ